MKKIKISPYLFRSLDIRGADAEFVKQQKIEPGSLKEKSAHANILDKDIAYVIGRAIGQQFSPSKVVVGHDARLSSPGLTKSIIRGLNDQGVDVDFIGLVSSDKLYFAVGYYKYEIGVINTGSHTIKQLNGFKISKYKDGKVMPIAKGSGMTELKEMALKQDFLEPKRVGKTKRIDISDDFNKYILSLFDYKKFSRKRVVFDAANGAGGVSFEKIIDALPIESTKLFFNPDGNFPNHEPDPMVAENIKELTKIIKKKKADFGVAWDGDADRVALITSQGEILTGSFISPILLKWVLKKYPHSTVIITPPMSWASKDLAQKENAKIEYSKVGNSFVKMAMEEHDAPFAAEEADHFMFRETFNAESGILPVLIVLELMTETGKDFNQLLNEVVGDYKITGDVNIEITDGDRVIEKVKEHYQKEGGSISELDGLSVNFDDWHFCLRPSLNDPVVRLNLEARDENKMIKETKKIKNMVKKFDI